MTQQIIIYEWVPKIKSLAEKFNKYAKKRSLSNIAETIDILLKYMEKDGGKVGEDAAQALNEIRQLNPQLFTSYTNQKIDNALNLASNGIQYQYGNPDYTDYTDQPPYYDYSESTEPMKNSDYLFSLSGKESSTSNQDYSKYYEIPENPKESEDLEGSELAEDPLSQSIEQLKIQNVKKVRMCEEFKKRKCAMGDGMFEDYDPNSGPIYECTCGTLYHEACLKIQAIYTGHCQICDRIFLERK